MRLLFRSGIPFTILQPAPYMQNLLTNWKSIVEEGVLCVPYSVDAKFSFIDLEDVADAASIVLGEKGHLNAIYELAGTPPASHVDVAEIFSHVLKRNVLAKKENIKDWKSRAGGLNNHAMDGLVRMFEYYDQWGLVGNQNVLREVIKHEPRSLEAFISNTLKEHDAVD
jgi:uncharacterized protein YbjT (DUF2867 family)